jgi:hypothetical protein
MSRSPAAAHSLLLNCNEVSDEQTPQLSTLQLFNPLLFNPKKVYLYLTTYKTNYEKDQLTSYFRPWITSPFMWKR